MQNKLHKAIYNEFVYCDPCDHLLKPNNKLTRPKNNSKHLCSSQNVINIQSDITGHYGSTAFNNVACNNITQNITPIIDQPNKNSPNISPELDSKSKSKKQFIYDEPTFEQIELRGFITKELLKQSLERSSNLFHIDVDIFENLCNKYHQFKEILHTLTTEFDNTIECIIDTGKELTKKISHIIYELYLAVMRKVKP